MPSNAISCQMAGSTLFDNFSFLDLLIPLMRLGVVTCLEASCIHSKQ